jgi:hypothetical protein
VGQGREEPYDDLPPLRDVVIPDDARALEADRLAWLHEQRVARRRRRVQRLLLTRRWDRFGLAGPVVVLALLAAAVFGSLSVVLIPRPGPSRPGPQPLASPTVAPGSAGGVLPDLTLAGARGPVHLRALRPAVLAVVPAGCECPDALEHSFREASEYGVGMSVLGESAQARQLSAVAGGIGNGTVQALTGDLRAVTRAYRPTGLTLLLVRADGVVTDVLRDVGPDLHAELALAGLALR